MESIQEENLKFESTGDENLDFVLLLEKNKEVLEKSMLPSSKKKKDQAVDAITETWVKITGKMLTQSAILKKICNLKARAKFALNNRRPLQSWQAKILKLTMVINSLNLC